MLIYKLLKLRQKYPILGFQTRNQIPKIGIYGSCLRPDPKRKSTPLYRTKWTRTNRLVQCNANLGHTKMGLLMLINKSSSILTLGTRKRHHKTISHTTQCWPLQCISCRVGELIEPHYFLAFCICLSCLFNSLAKSQSNLDLLDGSGGRQTIRNTINFKKKYFIKFGTILIIFNKKEKNY